MVLSKEQKCNRVYLTENLVFEMPCNVYYEIERKKIILASCSFIYSFIHLLTGRPGLHFSFFPEMICIRNLTEWKLTLLHKL